MDKGNVIVADNLRVAKGKATILRELTFGVKEGSIVGLLGPSGSGKTTLMRSIVGTQKVSGGVLSVFNKPAGDKTLRPRTGYVTQAPAVYTDLTVAQNLTYFATLMRAGKADVARALEAVHLQPQAKQLVETLSGGEKTRVSLAVALLGNPDLLVFDEPTVGLDPVLREDLWQLFHDLAASGKTLIVSSHVMDEAEHCDSLLLLREGALIWDGTKEALLMETVQSSVEAAFIAKVKEVR